MVATPGSMPKTTIIPSVSISIHCNDNILLLELEVGNKLCFYRWSSQDFRGSRSIRLKIFLKAVTFGLPELSYGRKEVLPMDAKPLRTGGQVEDILVRYQNTVYGLALARTGSRADAEDVFQEVFLAYFQSNKAFRDEEHQKAWLLRTTINFCRRVTSSSWRKRTVPLSQREGQASSLPVRGRKLRVAGCDGAGGVPPCPHLPLLFSGADHTGNRPRSVYPSWCGPNAVVPWSGEAAPDSERRLFR